MFNNTWLLNLLRPSGVDLLKIATCINAVWAREGLKGGGFFGPAFVKKYLKKEKRSGSLRLDIVKEIL